MKIPILENRFEIALERSGLTQQELANKMLVGKDSITNWKKGKHIPTEENIKNMCDILDVMPEYLTGVSDYINLYEWKNSSVTIPLEAIDSIFYMLLGMNYIINKDQLKHCWAANYDLQSQKLYDELNESKKEFNKLSKDKKFDIIDNDIIDVITPTGEHTKTTYSHIAQAYCNFISTFKGSLIDL